MIAARPPVPVPLAQVLTRLETEGLVEQAPESNPTLEGVGADSRTTAAGDLFCAWAGHSVDAHDYVAAAVEAGARAVLVERPLPVEVPQVVVSSGRMAAALAADEIMGRPGEELVLVGVTGTNGKTTTVWILRHVLSARWAAASLGTVGAVTEAGGTPLPGTGNLTTPGPVGMAKVMRAFVDRGVEAVAMEVSSHALDQARVHALRYSATVFTNLSRDHLDYHGSFERYRATKRELVDLLRPDGAAILNAAEFAWDGLERRGARALRYAVAGSRGAEDSDIVAHGIAQTLERSRFSVTTPQGEAAVEIPLLGSHNVENAIAALGACLSLGMELDQIVLELGRGPQVPGRLELAADRPCRVFIDYAHTPDALARVLETLRAVAPGRLIALFGAGGDRDAGKRPRMGEAVARLADEAVVTSDNPRTEDPDAIIDDILVGMTGGARVHRVVDRREAIGVALDLAGEDDVVLLAGKGHETYQVVGTETIPFDERVIVRAWLDAGGAS